MTQELYSAPFLNKHLFHKLFIRYHAVKKHTIVLLEAYTSLDFPVQVKSRCLSFLTGRTPPTQDKL